MPQFYNWRHNIMLNEFADVDDDDIVACLPIPAVHRRIYKFAFDFPQYRVE